MSTPKQVTVFVEFKIKPDRIEEFKDAHRPVWAACAAEPELLFFSAFQDPTQPERFRFVEVWSKSREWFEKEQMTKPYYASLWPKSQPTWAEEPKIEYFEQLSEGFSCKDSFFKGGPKAV